jgi:AraC-like DNA-binding protein
VKVEHVEFGAVSSPALRIHKKTLPFLILVHTLSGEYHVRIGSRKWIVPAGMSFVVPPNTEVEFVHLPDKLSAMRALWAHLISVAYHAYDWADFFQVPFLIHGQASSKLGQILKEGRKVPTGNTLGRYTAAMARAYDLLSVISDALPEKPVRENHHNDARLATLLRFMRQHLADPLSIATLAKSVNLSQSQLHEMVRITTGKTPHRMLQELRVNEAAKLLVHPEVKIWQIAFDCGFTCPFHFSRTFKSIKGTAPSDYRAKAVSALAAYRSKR